MKHLLRISILSILCFSLLSACSSRPSGGTHYWQSVDSADGLYLTGPKAQQHLEQDIAECVHEIIELAKLAGDREKIPYFLDPVSDVEQDEIMASLKDLPYWDEPEFLGDLRVDHSDYHDFDGCMLYKGWRRVKYVHPDESRRAKEVYRRTKEISVRNEKTERKSARTPLFGSRHSGQSAQQEYMEDR